MEMQSKKIFFSSFLMNMDQEQEQREQREKELGVELVELEVGECHELPVHRAL